MMHSCIIILISLLPVLVHIASCDLAHEQSVANLKQLREKRGPGGGRCGPADLVSRCKYDVDQDQGIRWLYLAGDSTSYVIVTFDYDVSKNEAASQCPTGTHLAVIDDAVLLDQAASDVFDIKHRDNKYWVDVNTDLDRVDSFLLDYDSCTCFNDAFGISSSESTVMEVKRDEYKIKKKRSSDRGMMRGVICQKEEVTTTKPPPPTTVATGKAASGSPSNAMASQKPTDSMHGTRGNMDVIPTETAASQKSFDWIIFLLSVIAITLVIGLCVGCVICCRIKSRNRQKNVNQTVVCSIQPNQKEFAVSALPTAPPAYEESSTEYQGLMHPTAPNATTAPDRKSGIPQGVYLAYEVPMENPHISNYQQPAGLYNGSAGYVDFGGENQPSEYLYDELQINTTPEYSYAYADRKSVVDELNN